jgi:hypothetical protein
MRLVLVLFSLGALSCGGDKQRSNCRTECQAVFEALSQSAIDAMATDDGETATREDLVASCQDLSSDATCEDCQEEISEVSLKYTTVVADCSCHFDNDEAATDEVCDQIIEDAFEGDPYVLVEYCRTCPTDGELGDGSPDDTGA